MVIVVIILFMLTFILIKKDYKTESTRWLAGITFFDGIGSLTVVYEQYVMMDFINKNGVNNQFVNLFYNIDGIISVSVHYLVPYCMLMYGITYSDIVKKRNKKIIYSILFIPVILSFILLPIKSNTLKTPEELMAFFKMMSWWVIPYMVISICLLIYAYTKEKSYVMRKHKLLTIMVVGPSIFYVLLFGNLFRALGIENNFKYFVILIPVQFIGFLVFAYKYGIMGVKLKFERYKFEFDDMSEFISDSFIVLNEKLKIVEYNKNFNENFLIKQYKYMQLQDIIDFSKLSRYEDIIIKLINNYKENKLKSIEISINKDGKLKYFEVNANPILASGEYYGTVLLFKDITVYKKNMELIKQNQFQIIERERLISLSQLIGGIAHNLKTPLLSSAGGINIIKRDTDKLYKYIQNNCSDSKEVANIIYEVKEWEQRIIEYLKYMSDVITTVKGQVTEYSEIIGNSFCIKEVIDKISLLMTFELRRNKCVLSKKINIDTTERIKGDINSLIQVLNNLISNSIEVSKSEDVIILGAYKERDKVIFYVKNFGEKIPEEVQCKIFNKMVTTKGKNGTGLGLYISKSIIKGRFNGEMYFNTNYKETTFFIKIPLVKGEKNE